MRDQNLIVLIFKATCKWPTIGISLLRIRKNESLRQPEMSWESAFGRVRIPYTLTQRKEPHPPLAQDHCRSVRCTGIA